MTVDQFDQLFASMARPYTIYVCASAIAACCFIQATAVVALPLAAGIVGGAAYLRSRDKETTAKVTIAAGTPTPPVSPQGGA